MRDPEQGVLVAAPLAQRGSQMLSRRFAHCAIAAFSVAFSVTLASSYFWGGGMLAQRLQLAGVKQCSVWVTRTVCDQLKSELRRTKGLVSAKRPFSRTAEALVSPTSLSSFLAGLPLDGMAL